MFAVGVEPPLEEYMWQISRIPAFQAVHGVGDTLWLCQAIAIEHDHLSIEIVDFPLKIAIENDHWNSRFSHWTWWFSIVL